jgi:hypothetical protein
MELTPEARLRRRVAFRPAIAAGFFLIIQSAFEASGWMRTRVLPAAELWLYGRWINIIESAPDGEHNELE